MAAKRKKNPSFEEGMRELETLVAQLSGEELTLDESITLYEQGIQLSAQLQEQLARQKKRIEIIDPETAEIEAFEEHANGVS